VIYKNDALARERNLSPEARLEFHQAESSPHDRTPRLARAAIRRAFGGAELSAGRGHLLPTEALGEADALLRVPGAPLDNNICERILKKAILHRKNALFYKTGRGAHVGDIFMSLIHTAELCEADAFGYLTELECHAKDVATNPQDWMPWNYARRWPPPLLLPSDHRERWPLRMPAIKDLSRLPQGHRRVRPLHSGSVQQPCGQPIVLSDLRPPEVVVRPRRTRKSHLQDRLISVTSPSARSRVSTSS